MPDGSTKIEERFRDYDHDWPIGGAITVKKALKPYISYGTLPVLAVNGLFHLLCQRLHAC